MEKGEGRLSRYCGQWRVSIKLLPAVAGRYLYRDLFSGGENDHQLVLG